jgi:hypothetical protein
MAGKVGNTQFFGKGKIVAEPPSALEKALGKLKEIDKEYLIDKIDIPKVEKRIDGAYEKADTIRFLWETYVIADILGYIFVGILTLFFLMLAYLFRKYEGIKYLFIITALIVGINGGKFTKDMIDSSARSSRLENIETQRFDYSDNMVINMDLVNTGKFDYSECKIHFKFYKKTDRLPINIINKLKPLHEQAVTLRNIKRKTYKHIRMTIYTISRKLDFTMENSRKCK